MKTKTIFLLPGFKQKAASGYFEPISSFLKSKKFHVIKVPVRWDYRTMSDYVSDFKEFYLKHKTGNDYFFGFSYGAVIAFISAVELKTKKIYLCSLSGDFKEDLPQIRTLDQKIYR